MVWSLSLGQTPAQPGLNRGGNVSTYFKLLNGNPGKRPLNEQEPKPEAALPTPPTELCADAKLEWARVAPLLHQVGTICEIDRAAFAAYCQAYGRWLKAERAIATMAERDQLTSGLMIKTTNGNPIQNPLVGIANRAMVDMVRYAAEFGMTPSARSRIAKDPFAPDPQESFSQFWSLDGAARTRDQAKIAFWTAQEMARRSRDFRRSLGVEVLAHRIVQARSASYFEAVSADADSLEGKNVHFGLIDEFHAHRSRDVYDAIETGAGKRDQSMLWAITTAGSDTLGVCYEQQAYVRNILKGTIKDENYFGIIYTIDEGDDWTAEEIWRKANPNYGVSVEPEHLALQCRKAMLSPASRASFLTKHLDVWIQADQALFDMTAWERCADRGLALDQFDGERCLIAVDLAPKTDIAAVILLFERDGKLIPFGRFYVPEAAFDVPHQATYRAWASAGQMITTPGNIIDFDRIETDILEATTRFQVGEIAYDPWQATQLATRLQTQGARVVEFRQTVANFSEPTKQLDALMRLGKIVHDGNPVLAWMIGNVVGHYDAKENVYPRKERPENKIDGAVALIMAIGRHMVFKEQPDLDEFLKNAVMM